MELFKGILHTATTPDKVKELSVAEKWVGKVTEEDINNMVKYSECFDGLEVILAPQIGGDGYALISWSEDENSKSKVKEAFWYLEQDPVFGTYCNDREGFNKVWDADEYSSDAMVVFKKDEVEILETIGK